MATFHDKIVLNKYMLSLFGIDALNGKIASDDGVGIFKELKASTAEGYTEEGNTRFLELLKNHYYTSDILTETMLQAYDENIVRFTKQISEHRAEPIVWKYFQYLSLLFTEIYLDRFFGDRDAFLAELNSFAAEFNSRMQPSPGHKKKKGETPFQVSPFRKEELNKLAFWNATGSGKTLLMHINIRQYLYYAEKHGFTHQNKILLITPNEPLSRQHLADFALSGIPANIFSKNQSGMFMGREVEILEISKLSLESKDKTVAVESFETDNLVLIDEGHGGMKGDTWKDFRDQLSKTGFAFEYSATFGQAISSAGKKSDPLTQEYSKSILFDYSYKYFYSDGYGKDYRILNLKEDHAEYTAKYLTANLLSFYQQLVLFRDKPDLVAQYRLFKPLWVFVGGSVNAVREEKVGTTKRSTSDVLEVVHFLTAFLKEKDTYTEYIKILLSNEAGLYDSKGYSIFDGSFSYLQEQALQPEEIYSSINEVVFHNRALGANLYLDNLKGAQGELGLKVGATGKYFGVINVGDEDVLHKLALENGVLGTALDFSSSLFAQINEARPEHEINLLIGSKKFSEGWSSWRVSSMGLMNIGKGEGSQIIQLFGRGVRLQGYNFSLKRSKGLDDFQRPDDLRKIYKYLRPMETLQIFGVKANYMERFKELLESDGLPANTGDWVTVEIPVVNKVDITASGLKVIQVKESEQFKKKTTVDLKFDTSVLNKQVEIDWYPKIDVLVHKSTAQLAAKRSNTLSAVNLAFLDFTRIYFEIMRFKADKGYSNMSVAVGTLREIINDNSWYRILIPDDQLAFTSFHKVALWEELAIVLLKKYMETFYLYHKNAYNADNVESRALLPSDDNLIMHYDVRVNADTDLDGYREKLEMVRDSIQHDTFTTVKIAHEVEAFDNMLHLYKPLFYVGKGQQNAITVAPVALDSSEKMFVDTLAAEAPTLKSELTFDEIFLLRNQSRKGIGFFAEGNNFYPDFMLWIKKGAAQYLSFVDPKGIRNSKGINDAKIQFHRYLKEKVEPQVAAENLHLNSFIVSNTPLLNIHWRGDLTETEFNNNNVFFQEQQKEEYIKLILNKVLGQKVESSRG